MMHSLFNYYLKQFSHDFLYCGVIHELNSDNLFFDYKNDFV